MEWASTLRRDLGWGLALGASIGVLSLAVSRLAILWLVLALLVAPLVWWMMAGAPRWVLALLAAVVLLPPLPFPWGDAGFHPAILVAALGLWAGAARLGAWRIRWSFLSSALAFFFFALLLSVPMAALYSGWEAGLGSLARVGLFGIAVYLFFYIAHGPGQDLAPERVVRLLFWAGFASAAFACLDFYFQFPATARFAEQFVWLPSEILRRAQGVFYEAIALGSFCAFLLVMIVSIAALRLGGVLRLRAVWLVAAALVSLAALAFSYSRSAMAGLLVAVAAIGWLERQRFRPTRRTMRWIALATAVLAAVGALAARLFPEFLPNYYDRLWYSGQYLISAPETVLAPRLEGWRFLADWIAQNPWHAVFGIGYKTLPYSSFIGRPVIADNMYLSLLVETGCLGLLALLLLNAVVLITTYRQARSTGLRRFFGVWMFAFWCGQTVQMLSGDILTYWRLLPLYFAALALGARADEDPVSGPI